MEEFRRRKRYNLSLKKKNPNEIPQTFTKIETKEKNDVSIVEREWNQTADTMDSQNFHLRISDSFNLDDSEELTKPKKIPAPTRNQRESIIVISDSSDEEILLPRQPPENNRFQSCIKTNNNNKAHLSSGTNSPLIEDDDSELWKHNTDKNREYSSDETNFELNCDDDKYSVIESSVTNKIDKIRSNEEPVSCQIPREKLDSLRNVRNNGTTEPAKLSTLTTLHSKDIAKNIMKIITSKKIESPVIQKDHIIDETASEIVSDQESDRLPQPVWIEETASEASPSPPKATKTQVTRVLNPPIQTTNNDQLSEQKKRQISLWLMNNSPNDDRSDDSISYIPPSHRRTSESSGNSSLDRLEANYETPNNRNKFRDKLNFKQLANNVMNSPNLNKTVTPRQTVMDDYLKKTKSSVRSKKTYTPLPVVKTKPAVVSPTIETPKTTIEDCADILDELYGDAWRHKADVILPRTEPRRNVKMTDRGVQTERIKVPKKMVGRLVEDEKSFDNFVKNVKPNTNSTKKNHKGYRRDSFIVDSSDSDTSTGETTYMTALTNPRISDLQREERKKPPMSENTRKAILICDSESEDDTTPVRSNVDHRRRLLFSDDEEDKSTETSEYDPDDVVPPKTVLPKPVRSVMGNKILAKPATSSTVKRIERHKSFLASLSATVPMAATHPDAKKFKQNFKNTKDELVKYLFKLYNEKIFDNQLPHDMLIEWNVRMTGTAGFCYNKRTMGLADFVRTSRIVLATKILDTADRLRDTLVHEMCHAAAWIINQVSDGHGPFWRGWASKAMKVFPELPPIKRCHDYKINTKYTYRCMQCGYSIGRHSKSLDTEKKRCGHCFGRFELLVNRVTKSGTKLQIPKTPNDRQPTAFALFVKDNYSTVKKTRQGLAHKEVMQLLGQQFSAIKLSKKTREERRPSVEISD